MKKFFECVLVTICYWIVVFLGPALVILWNNWCYYVSGLGYGEGSLMYKALVFLSQPISCVIAVVIAGNVGKGKHNLCTFVNCVVNVCLFGAFALFYIVCADYITQMYTMVVSAIACIITAATQAEELNPTQRDLEIELEKCKIDNAKLLESLNSKECVSSQPNEKKMGKGKTRHPAKWMNVVKDNELAIYSVIAALAFVFICFLYEASVNKISETSYNKGYSSAHQSGYSDGFTDGYTDGFTDGVERGKTDQREQDMKAFSINGMTMPVVKKLVIHKFGITPSEAVMIYDYYTIKQKHGGYTKEEYQNAVEALLYIASLFGN